MTTIRQPWSPEDRNEEPGSACGAFSIWGVPTALLIDRDGRIVWRGHPGSIDVAARIEALLGGGR